MPAERSDLPAPRRKRLTIQAAADRAQPAKPQRKAGGGVGWGGRCIRPKVVLPVWKLTAHPVLGGVRHVWRTRHRCMRRTTRSQDCGAFILAVLTERNTASSVSLAPHPSYLHPSRAPLPRPRRSTCSPSRSRWGTEGTQEGRWLGRQASRVWELPTAAEPQSAREPLCGCGGLAPAALGALAHCAGTADTRLGGEATAARATRLGTPCAKAPAHAHHCHTHVYALPAGVAAG